MGGGGGGGGGACLLWPLLISNCFNEALQKNAIQKHHLVLQRSVNTQVTGFPPDCCVIYTPQKK